MQCVVTGAAGRSIASARHGRRGTTMHELIISGGDLVDGTGAPVRHVRHLVASDGVIVAIDDAGRVLGVQFVSLGLIGELISKGELDCPIIVRSHGGRARSLITGEVLGLDLAHTLGLMRRIYNTSLHHLVLNEGRWELVSFNSVPHLSVAERTLV